MKFKLSDLIDTKEICDSNLIVNQRISLWIPGEDNDGTYCLDRVWQGMSWDVPQEFRDIYVKHIYGAIPETIDDADIINIELWVDTDGRV